MSNYARFILATSSNEYIQGAQPNDLIIFTKQNNQKIIFGCGESTAPKMIMTQNAIDFGGALITNATMSNIEVSGVSANSLTSATTVNLTSTTGTTFTNTNAAPFTFTSSGQQRMVITTSGFIGIGTSTPTVPLQVAGAATIGGIATFASNIVANGPAQFGNSMTVAGVTTLNSVNVSGATSLTTLIAGSGIFNSNLAVVGDAVMSSDATIAGRLTVTRVGTFNSNVSVVGDLSVGVDTNLIGKLTVNKTTILNSNLSVSSTVAMGSDATIAGKLTVNSTGTFNSNIMVLGNSTLGANVAVTGSLTTTGVAVFNSNVSAASIIVAGTGAFNSNLMVAGTCSATGNVISSAGTLGPMFCIVQPSTYVDIAPGSRLAIDNSLEAGNPASSMTRNFIHQSFLGNNGGTDTLTWSRARFFFRGVLLSDTETLSTMTIDAFNVSTQNYTTVATFSVDNTPGQGKGFKFIASPWISLESDISHFAVAHSDATTPFRIGSVHVQFSS